MNYYERHLGDYAKDTAHLSMLEHGAYTLLIDRYYATEAGIPSDQAYRVARARTKDERSAVDAVLAEFFNLRDGVWIKNRCEEEIAKAKVKITAARTNGKKGGRPRANPEETQEKPAGFQLGSETETQTKALQSPVSSLQKKDKLAEARSVAGLNPEAFDQWLNYRAERKPAIKLASLVAAAEQLAGFGDPSWQAAVVKHSIANGYQGLFEPKDKPKKEQKWM